MSQDVRIHHFYDSLRSSNFIDTNLMCKMGLEFFLSHLLLKGDLNRVVYAKLGQALRRRVETLGNGSVRDGKLDYVKLDLPYAIFSQTSTIEEDDRGATQNASQIVKGWMQPLTGINVKAAAVKATFEATIFFDSRDDVDVASQLLYWEKTPNAPFYYVIKHEICGQPLDIPVFITLDSFDSDVEYDDMEWLSKSKIFPVKCTFTVRTYQTLIEDIEGVIKLPLRFSGLYAYNDEEVVYTQKTVLNWGNMKFHSIKEHENGTEEQELVPRADTTGVVSSVLPTSKDIEDALKEELGEDPIKRESSKIDTTAGTITDAVYGYFSDDRDCTLEDFGQDQEKTTEHSAVINWKINESEEPLFRDLVIYVPGFTRSMITDVNQKEFELTGLNPGSTYECTIIITSKKNNKLTYKLNVTTKGQKALGGKLSDMLVGRKFV